MIMPVSYQMRYCHGHTLIKKQLFNSTNSAQCMKNIMEIKHEDKMFNLAWSFALLNDTNQDNAFSSLSMQERKMAEKFPSKIRAKEFIIGRYCARQEHARS